MIWLPIVAGLGVLALASYAGLGKLGEMPDKAVNDRPKGRIPEGTITASSLAELRIPHAMTGYDPAAVDSYLAELVSERNDQSAEQPQFKVVQGGYDMQVVDALIDRFATKLPGHIGLPPVGAEGPEIETVKPRRAAE